MKQAEICTLLDIKESTLRKYALELEKVGYMFQRNSKQHRIYTQKDVITIKEILDIMKSTAITLEMAIKKVLKIKEEPSVSQIITYYKEREKRLVAIHGIDLREKDRQIANLKEEIEQLKIYQSRKEIAATIDKPSFIEKLFRYVLPL